MASVNQTNTETVLKAMLGKVLRVRDRVEYMDYGLSQAHRSGTILN